MVIHWDSFQTHRSQADAYYICEQLPVATSLLASASMWCSSPRPTRPLIHPITLNILRGSSILALQSLRLLLIMASWSHEIQSRWLSSPPTPSWPQTCHGGHLVIRLSRQYTLCPSVRRRPLTITDSAAKGIRTNNKSFRFSVIKQRTR